MTAITKAASTPELSPDLRAEAIDRDIINASGFAAVEGGQALLLTLAELDRRAAEDVARGLLQRGEVLIIAKGKLKHGEWESFLREHCCLSERSARVLMQIRRMAQSRPEIADGGMAKARLLASLDDEQYQAIIGRGDLPALTSRELEDLVRRRDKQIERLESKSDAVARRLAELEAQNMELKDAVAAAERAARPADAALRSSLIVQKAMRITAERLEDTSIDAETRDAVLRQLLGEFNTIVQRFHITLPPAEEHEADRIAERAEWDAAHRHNAATRRALADATARDASTVHLHPFDGDDDGRDAEGGAA